AFASPELRDAALATPASRLTEKTVVDPADVQSHLEFVRRYWYSVAVSERLPGIGALAAPVFDDRNRVVGSVGLIGSHSIISSSETADDKLVREVQQTAQDISRELHATAWQQRLASVA